MRKLFLYLFLVFPVVAMGQGGEFKEFSYPCKDQAERPYIVYVPENAKEVDELPLLVFLHGGISSSNLKSDPLAYIQQSPLLPLADAGPFLLLFPYGQKGAGWFDPIGTDMVLGETVAVVERFGIYESKVFLSGFSDGASGTLYLAMTQASLFAGYIAMNGQLRVSAQIGANQVYVGNLNGRALFMVNTKGDVLYPSRDVLPIVEYLRKSNPELEFRDLEGGHEMSYLEEEGKSMVEFIRSHRKPALREISFETSDLTSRQLDWLTVLELDTLRAAADWHAREALTVEDSRASFGIKFDYAYQGPGLKVKGFKGESATAVKMGIQVGDVVLMMGEDSIKGAYDPYLYLAEKVAGDPTSVELLRAGEVLKLRGEFNAAKSFELFQHVKASGKIQATLKGKTFHIQTSRISRFRIETDELPIQLKALPTVYLNGERYKFPENASLENLEIEVVPQRK